MFAGIKCTPTHYAINNPHLRRDPQPQTQFSGHRRFHIRPFRDLNSPANRNNSYIDCSEDHTPNLIDQRKLPDFTQFVLTSTENRSLGSARSVHAIILKSGIQPNVFLLNHILNMYSKCSSTRDTRQAFERIPQPNTVSWNILISHYTRSGLHHQANAIFHQMLNTGVEPDSFTFSTLLRTCTELVDIKQGASLHAYALKLNCNQDVSVATALVTMYAACGSEESAKLFFWGLEELDLETINSMIAGFVRNGNCSEALKLLDQMMQLGISPDQVTFLSSLKAATVDGFLSSGTQIHAQIIKMGFESAIPICSALINMYANHGEIELAYETFIRQQPSNSLVLRTAIIVGLTQNGEEVVAIDLFRQMQVAGIEPDKFAYQSILQTVMGACLTKQGKEIHGHMVRTGFNSDPLMGNQLIKFYGKCNRAIDGFRVFDQMENREPHSWSQIILLCLEQHYDKKALEFFLQMINEGQDAEKLTVVTIIQVCTNLSEVQFGCQFHGYLLKLGFHSDITIASALVTFYSRHGMVEAAQKIFNHIAKPDTVLWTALISAYNESGDGGSALELFQQMVSSGTIPDAYTLSSVLSSCARLRDLRQGRTIQASAIKRMASSDVLVKNALISLYGECRLVNLAAQTFHQMPEHSVASWATMIASYAQNGQPENSSKLFTQMQREQVEPDELVISGMLNACSSLPSLDSGRCFHALAIRQGFNSTIPVCNSLITMYSRCGNIDEAHSIFKNMGVQNTISWNTMISGLAQNGRSQEALRLFEEMRKVDIRPDAATFMAVLSACSHEGMVHNGQQYFNMMRYVYDLKPTEDHYSCMIDLFSRAGDLDQAITFMNKMPFSPSASAWMAFLSACRTYGRMKLGKLAAEQLISMKPDDPTAYVLLANMYAEAKQWEMVREAREKMRFLTVKKEPGCSWIEINKRVHVFTVHDISHLQTEEIYSLLEHLYKQIKTNN
ncbi:pentatricopeptide repeat-containing protein At5g27110-like [Tasmannia lanceolata]|uniref:pentatricopeptide repeat-containing protein At5g27110-like n=1 Tax=Tasmannia lanceolata TaxID=3420 RepID=UPI004063D542